MRSVIQRVNRASVTVNNKTIAAISRGLVIFLGVEKGDTKKEARYLAKKIKELRVFSDPNRKMNLCAEEAGAEILVVSQFTLCSDLIKGRRPSFDRAASPDLARKLYLDFIKDLKQSQLKIEQGIFKEYMTVHIENDGPVTFILEK
jgi:D-tyrosyl-tRNA(Tyr) deacylase